MTKSAWGSGPDVTADMTVRCQGKRVLRVHRGEPARIQVPRANHPSNDLVLLGEAYDIRALVAAGNTDLPRSAVWNFSCPNHPDGHDVEASLLRTHLTEAREDRRETTVQIASVVRAETEPS
jgi:hypothetical protein